MKPSAPKTMIWWLAVIAGILGIVLHMGWIIIPALKGYIFWIESGAFALLAAATAMKGQ